MPIVMRFTELDNGMMGWGPVPICEICEDVVRPVGEAVVSMGPPMAARGSQMDVHTYHTECLRNEGLFVEDELVGIHDVVLVLLNSVEWDGKTRGDLGESQNYWSALQELLDKAEESGDYDLGQLARYVRMGINSQKG